MGFKGKPKKGKGGGRIQITNIEELQLRNEHFDTQQRERKARKTKIQKVIVGRVTVILKSPISKNWKDSKKE